jgi:hypothetical protein
VADDEENRKRFEARKEAVDAVADRIATGMERLLGLAFETNWLARQQTGQAKRHTGVG